PEITVPLATYTSWNLRDPWIGAPDQRVSFEGSYLPFPKSAAESRKLGDSRKSIGERYSSREDYISRYAKAVDDLIKQRWVLPEDRETLLHRGDRKSTRLNSSHQIISYAVFCLKKKINKTKNNQ